jgi:hypothetical protein
MNQQVDEKSQIYHMLLLQVVQAKMVQQMDQQENEECQIYSGRVPQVVQVKMA